MTLVRKTISFAICLAILLTSFAAPAQKRSYKRMHRAAKPSPSVTEIDTDQLKSLLKRDAQRPLLVNFWATWCDPCRDEFPDLVKIDTDYRSKGLDFIAVSLDDLKDINTEVPKFLRTMNAHMPTYLLNVPDPEVPIKAVDREWGGALPATFLYDAKGNIAYRHFGRIGPEQLRAEIEKQVGRN
jgi:thiol-disulfide isomerase/thioredoxin